MYLDSNSCLVFPGSTGVSPAQQAARMAALPGYKLQEHNGIHMMSGYLAGRGFYDRLVQEGHAHGCDSSCYDCLRDYNNADLHALLDWRLGLDLARLAVDAQVPVDLHTPYWQPLAEQAARGLERVVGQSATIELIEDSWVLHVKGQVRAVLVHPLWSSQHPHLMRLAAHLGVAATMLPRCTHFDVLHRPGWCISRLGS